MYGPAFFIGHLIQRFGALNVMLLGVVLMLACVGINLTGVAVSHFWLGLGLLGLGWSCLFVSATNLLTYAYKPAERAKVQAVNDACVFAAVGLAAWGSGALEHVTGWNIVNLAILPSLGVVAIATFWLRRRRGLRVA
ncbi:MAG TPA: MFS transporter [Alphaproteobacteria bacterium]|nr:MFS transporter [Alphaproteobacteria bacterium]